MTTSLFSTERLEARVGIEPTNKGFAEPFLIARPATQLTESPVSRGTISGYFPVRFAEVRR